jgi:hypothetical protein
LGHCLRLDPAPPPRPPPASRREGSPLLGFPPALPTPVQARKRHNSSGSQGPVGHRRPGPWPLPLDGQTRSAAAAPQRFTPSALRPRTQPWTAAPRSPADPVHPPLPSPNGKPGDWDSHPPTCPDLIPFFRRIPFLSSRGDPGGSPPVMGPSPIIFKPISGRGITQRSRLTEYL